MCGNPKCRCKDRDKPVKHGPYHYLSHRYGNKTQTIFLTKKKLDHAREWTENHKRLITCLDFGEVCAHNNLAERLLKSSVIMRKITFGNRSNKGVLKHQALMSLHQLTPLTFFHQLITGPTAAAAAIFPKPASTG